MVIPLIRGMSLFIFYQLVTRREGKGERKGGKGEGKGGKGREVVFAIATRREGERKSKEGRQR